MRSEIIKILGAVPGVQGLVIELKIKEKLHFSSSNVLKDLIATKIRIITQEIKDTSEAKCMLCTK